MKTLVIIPSYNEAENIEQLVFSINSLDTQEISVLIVDDSSPDGTGDIADKLARRFNGKLFVFHRPGKAGLGSAYRDGFRFALENGFEAVCEMDADGSHDPIQLMDLIAEIEKGADVAIGSRRVPGGKIVGWGPHRHLMSRGAILVCRLVLGLRTRDITSGFRCYRSKVISDLLRISIQSNSYAFQEETLTYCEELGFVVKEIPIVFRDRARGYSKLMWSDVGEFFAVMWSLRRKRTNRLAMQQERITSSEKVRISL
jgi:dolichol-phosphate mannosyltransferase